MYFKDLPDSDRKHLKEMGIFTLKHFKHVANKQVEYRKESPRFEPCYICKEIARKLRLPV